MRLMGCVQTDTTFQKTSVRLVHVPAPERHLPPSLSTRKAARLGTLIAVDGGLLVLAVVVYVLGQIRVAPGGDKAPV
jgi:hypothetical protein